MSRQFGLIPLLLAFGGAISAGQAPAQAPCKTVIASASAPTQSMARARAQTQIASRLAQARTALRGQPVRSGRVATHCRPGPTGGPVRCTARTMVCQ